MVTLLDGDWNCCYVRLQCLSNVAALTEYMVDDRWEEELNVDNPLGMHGEVASSYAKLIKILWCGMYSYTIPRDFKACSALPYDFDVNYFIVLVLLWWW